MWARGLLAGVEMTPLRARQGWVRGGSEGVARAVPLTAAPFPRVPDNGLPYFHKRPQIRMLLLALLCVAVSVVWGVFRNEDR